MIEATGCLSDNLNNEEILMNKIEGISINELEIDVRIDELAEKDRVYFYEILNRVTNEANRQVFFYNNRIIEYLQNIVDSNIKNFMNHASLPSISVARERLNNCNVNGIEQAINILKEEFSKQHKQHKQEN